MFHSDNDKLSRDPNSKALLNNDKRALQEYKARKKQKAEQIGLLQRIDKQDQELAELKAMVNDLLIQVAELRSRLE